VSPAKSDIYIDAGRCANRSRGAQRKPIDRAWPIKIEAPEFIFPFDALRP